MSRELSRLLEHPAIWRGRSAARTRTLPTGFPALDEGLPGGGWPQTGLIEILPTCFGAGELSLLLPTLAAVTRRPEARWCVWVAPPLQPFAPALAEHGIALERVLVVQPPRAHSPSTGGRPRIMKRHDSIAQAQGCAPPPQVAGVEQKTTLFCSTRAGPGRSPDPALHPSEKNSTLWAFEQTLRSGACDIALAWARGALPRQIRRLHLAAERGSTLGVLFRPQEAARDSSPAALRVTVEPAAEGARVTLLKSRGGARGAIEIAWR